MTSGSWTRHFSSRGRWISKSCRSCACSTSSCSFSSGHTPEEALSLQVRREWVGAVQVDEVHGPVEEVSQAGQRREETRRGKPGDREVDIRVLAVFSGRHGPENVDFACSRGLQE